jgi:hypothetical protein
MYQINTYALDLLAYFNSDGHIMSVGIASLLTVDFGTPSYKFTVNICTYLIF